MSTVTHCRHQITFPIPVRSIGQRLLAIEARPGNIFAEDIRQVASMSHRLDARRVNFTEQIHVAQNAAQLHGHPLQLILRQQQAG